MDANPHISKNKNTTSSPPFKDVGIEDQIHLSSMTLFINLTLLTPGSARHADLGAMKPSSVVLHHMNLLFAMFASGSCTPWAAPSTKTFLASWPAESRPLLGCTNFHVMSSVDKFMNCGGAADAAAAIINLCSLAQAFSFLSIFIYLLNSIFFTNTLAC